jgi:hypothetical protein
MRSRSGCPGSQPLAATHELLDLRLVDPVVLVVVEHRKQDVEVIEQLGQPEPPGEPKAEVTPGAPVREGRVERQGSVSTR